MTMTMKIQKAFKYRLKTNDKVEKKLSEYCGCARHIWNKFLALNLDRLNNKQKMFWYHEMSFWTTRWRNSDEYGFLKECPSQVLQQKLKDLDRAFKDCFDKKQPLKRTPVWRKKNKHNTIRYVIGFKIDDNKIFLPKIGWIKFFKSRDIVGTARNITVSKSGKHWYISIQTEQIVEQPAHSSTSQIGIDVGISKFAALSDGEIYDSVNSLTKNLNKLAKAQRKLKNKKKFSKNWQKAVEKVGKIHIKIANIRKDHLHKITTEISKNHSQIFIEDLKIKDTLMLTENNVETPSVDIKDNAKTELNRSISDQSWGYFRRFLEYKSKWNGGKVIAVDSRHISLVCSSCGNDDEKNKANKRVFRCIGCGYEESADINAAKNILAAGQAVIACGELTNSVKQEL